MNRYKFEQIKVDDFKSLYKIMEKSFPSIERRNYEDQKELFNHSMYKVIGYKDEEDNVCAFLAYWNLEDFNFIEHFAVDDSLRGNGIGTMLFKNYLSNTDKQTILEVELPEDIISSRRIKYYERLGMKLNDYDYLQPPLQKGNKLFPLKIMSYNKKLKYDKFYEFRNKIYKNVYKYDL